MIIVNMHEAKSRLSQLVLAAISGEEVILCSNGEPRVRLVSMGAAPIRRLTSDPELRVMLAAGYDPVEPATEDEWPEDCR
jgi:prevent-host-death family protein